MGKKNQDPDPASGSGMNNPDHIPESLETIFGLKYLNSLMWIRDPGWKKFGSGIQDPGWKKFGSGINILEPQHWIRARANRDSVPKAGHKNVNSLTVTVYS
jgi:hypothetical protein